jgi:hypothetical protein
MVSGQTAMNRKLTLDCTFTFDLCYFAKSARNYWFAGTENVYEEKWWTTLVVLRMVLIVLFLISMSGDVLHAFFFPMRLGLRLPLLLKIYEMASSTGSSDLVEASAWAESTWYRVQTWWQADWNSQVTFALGFSSRWAPVCWKDRIAKNVVSAEATEINVVQRVGSSPWELRAWRFSSDAHVEGIWVFGISSVQTGISEPNKKEDGKEARNLHVVVAKSW